MSDMRINFLHAPVDQTGFSALGNGQAPSQAAPANPPGVGRAESAALEKSLLPKEGVEPLDAAAAAIQKFMPSTGPDTRLRITQDSATGLFVYQSVNPMSGEVVSQYPSEDIMKFISYFRDQEGIVIDKSI